MKNWDLVLRARRTIYRSLLTAHCLLILRHHFFSTPEKISHFALLRHGQNLEAVRPALLNLFALYIGELRQVTFGPRVLNKLERIVLAQRMPLPIRRQKNPPQIRMMVKDNAEQIVN